jgi:ubiquinone/menaquinone biosynthesis C-methylase UbiE
MPSMLISKKLETFYTEAAEDERLNYGLGPLELERNKELISRFLPKKGAIILDIGGGPGVYSEWLTNLGYTVYLVDPVEKHIRQAKKRSAKLKTPFKAILGVAAALEFDKNSADLVILHGPLYHLQEYSDRLQALQEAYRVLKPGGLILAFAINHSVSSLTGLLNGMIHDPQFYAMCMEELSTGLHNPPAAWPGILFEAFYHKPVELIAEVTKGGFTGVELFAVEGIIWLDSKYFETRSNPVKKQAMMNLLYQTQQNAELLALSPHLMACGVKR